MEIEPIPEGQIEVGRYASHRLAMDRALVVLAMRLPCWLVPVDDGLALLVMADHADAVQEQLARSEAESRGWPPIPPALHSELTQGARLSALLWALAETLLFLFQEPKWVECGESDPAAIFHRGQLWRPVTALFLHADPAHLLGNLAAGYFVFCAALAALGVRRGWIAILLTAALGNLAAAALQLNDQIHSLGASTAVFAALGLLSGHAGKSTRAILPVLAGAVLLALYGSGTPDVDVVAHVCGFVSGVAGGIYAAHSGRMQGRTDRSGPSATP